MRKICFRALSCLRRASNYTTVPANRPAGKVRLFKTTRLRTTAIAMAWVIIALFTGKTALSQTRSLSIGDKVPDLAISNILFYPTGEARISDFRGRLLILDFWATWCSPCVAMMPKTDSLQKAFKGRVQLLPVTYQSKKEVEKLLGRLQSHKGLKVSLPFATGDTLLNKHFPHRTLPHYVWISDEGKVLATTDHEQITAANIEAMLQKQKPGLAIKNDIVVPYDERQPLISANTQIPEKPVMYQSAFTSYIEGIPSGYTTFRADSIKGRRIVATNLPLPWLYKIAYSEGKRYIHPKKVEILARDISRFLTEVRGYALEEWKRSNMYSYEIIVPLSMAGQEYSIMQQELQRLFPQYKAAIETKTVQCLALVRTSEKDLLKSRSEAHPAEFSPFGCTLQAADLSAFVRQLNAVYLQKLPTPVIDETGYTGPVDMKLEANLSNPEAIRQALKAYDLDLVVRNAPVEVLVIRDAK